MMMESKIVFLNFSRNLVLQGSITQVVGFIFLTRLSISFFSRGTKLMNFVHFYCMIYVYLTLESVL